MKIYEYGKVLNFDLMIGIMFVDCMVYLFFCDLDDIVFVMKCNCMEYFFVDV